MWLNMFIGNFTAKEDLKEQINGKSNNLKQLWKMRISSSCGIAPSSVKTNRYYVFRQEEQRSEDNRHCCARSSRVRQKELAMARPTHCNGK